MFLILLACWGPWASQEKNSWKDETIVNFRGSTPSGRSLFAGLNDGCVLSASGFEAPILRHFGTRRC